MASVDEKVVKLSMDDADLDKGTKRAINDLDALKKALEFKDAERGLEAVTQAAARVDMSPLSNGIANVSNQFNLLNTIASSAIFNVTNKAIDAGERLVKSLSVDQISAGWGKFADKTSAVQTIMASTSNQFTDTGEQMEYVENQLEKLNWFTDETSYRFLDMVSNIGKFTASNIALDKSVDSMQGIAAWAARSGAGVQGASRAMYNLSQSMAMGAVRLQDWMSIENANMATYEFKETALETAVELGVLTKAADGLYSTLDGTTTTIEGFRESLQKGWFTADVLVNTLDKYGSFASELNKLYEELDGNVPTTTLLKYIDDFVDGSLNMQQAMTATGMSAEELGGWLEKLGAEQYKLGRESFKAAQETKTFQEAIDYVKESVSSGWMRTFEYLFGNYEEAKEFFSNMSEWLYDIFVASGDARNGLLMLWKDEGGRDQFIQSLYQIMDNISTFVGMIKDAWNSVFPEKTIDDIWAISNGFSKFVNTLTPTKETVESVKNALSGLFSILKVLKDIIDGVWAATEPLRDSLNRLAGSLVWVLGQFGRKIFNKTGTITDSKALNDLYSIINKISTLIGDNLVNAFNILYTGAIITGRIISKIVDILKNGELSVSQSVSAISIVFGQLINGLTGGLLETSGYTGIINNSLSILSNTIQHFTGFLGNFLSALTGAEGDTKQIVSTISKVLGSLAKGVSNIFASITIDDVKTVAVIGSLIYLTTSLGTLFKSLSFISKKFFSLTERLKKTTSLDSFITQLNAALDKTALLQIGISVTLLVNALSKIAAMDVDKLAISVAALTGISAGLLIVMKQMGTASKDVKPGNIFKMGVAMSTLGAAFIVVSQAMSVIGKMDVGSVLLSLGTMTAIMLGVEKFSMMLDGVKVGKLTVVSASLSLLAVGLTAMMVPIGILSRIEFSSLLLGLLGLAGMLAEIVAFSKIIEKINVGSFAGASASLILLSTAVLNISIALASLSTIGFSDMLVGLTGLTGILGGLSLTALAISKIDKASILSAAASLLVLSASVSIIGGVISALSKIDFSSLMGSMAALLSMTLGLTGILELLKLITTGMGVGQIASISIALITLSGSMITLAMGLKLMEGVSWTTMGQGLTAFGTGLAILLAAGAIAQYTAIGAGIGIIVAALVGLSSIMLIAAGSIAIIVNSIKTLSDTIVALIAAAAMFGDELPNLVQTGIDALKVGFKGILSIVYESVPEMTLAITAVIAAVNAAILAAKSSTVLAIVAIGLAILEALKQFGGPIMDALTHVVNMMTEKLPELMLAIGDFIEQLFAGIGILVTKAIYGLFEGVLNLIPFFGQKLSADLHNESERVGEAYLDGFTKTVEDGQDEARNAGASVGSAAVNGLTSKDGIDSNSPSKKTQEAGKNFNDGFTETIKEGQEDASKAGSDLGVKAADSTEDGVKQGLENNKESTKNDIRSWFNDVVGDLDLGVDIPVNIRLFGGSGTSKSDWQVFEDAVTKYGDDAFSELSKMDEQGKLTSGLISRALRSGYISKRQADELAKSIRMEIAENQKDKYQQTGEEIGNYVGSGLASSKAPAAAARSQAQNVGEAFTDEIKKLDLADRTANSLLSLWKAQNPNATEAEQAAKEMELVAGQVVTQSERARYAQLSYTETLQKMGEAATETQEAYIKMIDEQTKLIELQNKLNESQMQSGEQTREAFLKMSDILHDYYYAKDGGRSTAEFLKSLGFTDREITEAAAKEAGYAIPKMVEETKEATVLATQTAGEQTVQLYANSVTTNLEALTPTFTNFGNTYATSLGTGMTEKSDAVAIAAVETVGAAQNEAGSDKVIEEWTDIGYQFMTGMIAGIVKGSPEVEAAIKSAVSAAIAAAKAVAGVASPSKETMWQASMWMAGYIKGIDDNQSVLENALVSPVKTAISNASSALNGSDFVDGFSKSIVGGVNESAGMLQHKVQSLLTTTTNEIDAFVRSNNIAPMISDMLGIDDETMHVNVVLDLDDSSLYGLNALSSIQATASANQNGSRSYTDNLAQSIQETNRRMSDLEQRFNQKISSGGESDSSSESSVQNFNLTQNNYSPKALSRVDIYRDTQKLVNQVSEKLATRSKR